MNLMSLTAVELGKKIKAGEVTAVDATKAALEQIKKLDGTYNCYVTVDEEGSTCRGCQSPEEDRSRRTDRTAGRCSGCDQRQYVYRGNADHLQFQDSVQFQTDLLRRGSAEPEKSRCSCDR